jgi:hypothetical protein
VKRSRSDLPEPRFWLLNMGLYEYPSHSTKRFGRVVSILFSLTKTTRNINNEDGNYVGTSLSFQNRLHVSGFQWKTPKHLSGCVV